MNLQYSGVARYKGLGQDPIGAITENLVHNLKVGNFELAKRDYTHLVTTIQIRGNIGKDIRHANARLGELHQETKSDIREARWSKLGENAWVNSQIDIGQKASAYANQLPTPMDDGRRPARTQSNGYIPQPPIENGESHYGTVAEKVTTAVIDGLSKNEPLDRDVLHGLISALDLQGAEIGGYTNRRIIGLYRLTVDFSAIEDPLIGDDPFSVAMKVVSIEEDMLSEGESELEKLAVKQ